MFRRDNTVKNHAPSFLEEAPAAKTAQPRSMESQMTSVEWEKETGPMTRIKVIGVGGGGCNAVEDMVTKGFTGVEFYVVNTDYQALETSRVPNKIHIGDTVTHGLGTGGLPALGEQAARQHEELIRAAIEGADMVFVTAGMGGGTGTGAAPVVAEVARSMDILCVAIVTKPFMFEGPQRMKRALEGIAKLKEYVDTMIVILNDKLMETVGSKTPLTEAFKVVNGVLAQGISAISDLISMPGLINVDFRDVRTIMGETGGAVMGVGVGRGENRATEAVKKACHSPLQEKIVIDGARGILINITGGPDLTMQEINEATSLVYESADPDANLIFGVVIDERMKDEMRVTIIATGFSELPDSNHPGFRRMNAVPVREREAAFTTASDPTAGDDDAPVASAEPDPIPAIARKRERDMAHQVPTIDFNRQDNPLRRWEEPRSQAAPERQPAIVPDIEPDDPTHPNPAFQDSMARVVGAPDEDPYDIPALQRRRKQRFFE
jgi:cell division protein FtsZ